ncbi:uncharacterized protein MYCFIDRAFT_180457 [Pseudocercospora fijiensis CIRAD86]|uniref:Uncharacterized protein n=1 Tax=Pseudocercospora fijiensis (strain CIRAD86) TaxID=383855 RepID=M3AHI4_PSEFD|nr:uncharacterized protein MYCFIDRAFT_180457 [Pseudocercospora fijiensis CIRAD86]EME76972.1 hypothetical protein MYCFIDRAFT_180457 [Pseudocercospora fijiensis CIRAD86]
MLAYTNRVTFADLVAPRYKDALFSLYPTLLGHEDALANGILPSRCNWQDYELGRTPSGYLAANDNF